MKQKLILLAIALQMFLPVRMMAENPSDDFKDGDTFTAKTVEGLEMTFKVISAAGKTCQVGVGIINNRANIALENDDIEGCVTIPNVVNGYNVIKIGGSAFYNCAYLTNVLIPNSVQTIEAYAFYNCI